MHANSTYNVLLFGVSANVFIQMVATHKFLAAFGALKSFSENRSAELMLELVLLCTNIVFDWSKKSKKLTLRCGFGDAVAIHQIV